MGAAPCFMLAQGDLAVPEMGRGLGCPPRADLPVARLLHSVCNIYEYKGYISQSSPSERNQVKRGCH